MTEKYIQAERKCSMDAALSLLEIRLPVEMVAKYTQLSVEEVEQLRQVGDLPVEIRNINVRHAGLDENETAKLRSRRKYLTDIVSNFITSYENGLKAEEQGRAEGRIEETIRIARNAVKLGLPLEQIAAATGVSKKELAQLQLHTDA